jgi:hypothetical protein
MIGQILLSPFFCRISPLFQVGDGFRCGCPRIGISVKSAVHQRFKRSGIACGGVAGAQIGFTGRRMKAEEWL